MKQVFLAVAAVLFLASGATAQEPGDVKKGAELARSVCAHCHAVGSGERRSPDPMAPSFASLATTPGMTGTALRVWLRTSHPTMPDYILGDQDRDDVVAYILSLNPKAPKRHRTT
jgi:mono/diheme cytochrome c family protein